MKNTLFKAMIIAAFALVLLTGSALAEEVDIYGYAGFNLRAEGIYSEDGSGTLIGVKWMPFTAYGATGEFAGIRSLDGVLSDYYDYDNGPYVPDFPVSDGFLFRDPETLDLLGGIQSFTTPETPSLIGEFAGFSLEGEAIVGDPASVPVINNAGGYNDGFVLDLLGGAYGHDEFVTGGTLDATYQFTFNQTSASMGFWEVLLTVEVKGTGFSEIPDVPEPGTLVLLGTGLLGAAVIARKKIRK